MNTIRVHAGSFAPSLRELRAASLGSIHQLATVFGAWILPAYLAPQGRGAHSRVRLWDLPLVFWCFLWPVAQPGTACREAIRQARSLCRLAGRPLPPLTTSPYCQARAALPEARLEHIQQAVVAEARRGMAEADLWQGHYVRVVEGTTVTMPDTPANQKAYPQQSVQRRGCGFPILRLLAFFDLPTGLISTWLVGPWRKQELTLFQRLWTALKPGDVLLGDRGFCTWGLLAQALARGMHVVVRARGVRRTDLRRGRALGRGQRLVRWHKPRTRPATISRMEWKNHPAEITLRLVRCRLARRGFRTRTVRLATTLLDPTRYPVEALGERYYRRWQMELAFRALKTTLHMDVLRARSPATVLRELHMHILVHNLVRRLMLEAARKHRRPLARLSFAGALAAARRYGETLAQTRSKTVRKALFADLLFGLAADLVPDRPGRREPRARKRRPKPYPLLTKHRRHFREIQHQNRYYIPRKAQKPQPPI